MTYHDPRFRAEMQSVRANAEQIRCDYCHADPGQACQNKATGEPLTNQPAHWQRVKGAV